MFEAVNVIIYATDEVVKLEKLSMKADRKKPFT